MTWTSSSPFLLSASAADTALRDTLGPILAYVPHVPHPGKGKMVSAKEKVMWTIVSLFVFLVFSQVPLFGIVASESADPLRWLRIISASNRGTLMELGITPLVTSGMIIQVLVGSGLLQLNMAVKEDKEIFEGTSKRKT